MADALGSLQTQLHDAKENLALIEERISEFVQSTDVPLQLIKDQRRLQKRVRKLRRRVADLRPIEVLRRATKLIAGPVAEALTGDPWKHVRQRLLTQASVLPHSNFLDTDLLQQTVDDLIQLTHDVRILLSAHRIESNPGQLEALEHHAGKMADVVMRIYRLQPGDAPELDALAGRAEK